jgi:hypothetical protein
MKNLLISLFILSSKFCFGQSDYIIVENKDPNKHYKRATEIAKRDSIKNITTVKLLPNSTANLIGKWYDFDDKHFLQENLISHCPIFVDENNAILEIGIFREKGHNSITGTNNFKDFQKKYLKRYVKEKSTLISSQIDENKNYYLYKLKSPSKFNQNNIYTRYHLIGKKRIRFIEWLFIT